MKSLLKKLAILWTVVCLTNAGTFGKSIAVNVFAEEPEQSAEPTKSAETAEEVQEEKKDDALEAEPSADTEIDQYEVSEKNADPKETAVPEESAVPEKKIISGSPEPSQESSATAESAEPFSSPEPVAEESLEAETESFEVDSLTVSATSYVNGIPSDAFQYNGHYYFVFNALTGIPNLSSYSKMEEYCENLGGHLATITSEGENTFIYQMIKNHFSGKDAYIGYSDYENSGTWKWVTGTSSLYENFAAGQPAGYYNHHIAQYYNDGRGLWKEASFDKNHAFVCEWDGLDDAEPWKEEPVQEPAISIPSDAYQYGGHYYYVFNALKGVSSLTGYSKMEEYCEKRGGHLATVTSEGENTFIYQMIKNHFSGKDAYIGYSDYENSGTWKWVTGTSSLYENFAAGQPAGYYNHHIAQYYNDGRGLWKEASFDKNHAFVCEWDGLDDAEPWKEEPVQEPAISIPSDAYQYGGHYYYVFNALKGVSSLTGYSKMEEYCEKRGGHLATVTSPGEDSFIFKMIKNHFGGKDAYFGYSDTVKSGIWRWITGETSVYSNFSAGQPAGYYNNHIAQYYNDGRGQWEEASFDKNHAFVCEWDHLDGQIAMYRLYNPNSGEHFYTGSTGELCNLTYAGWNLEGVGWLAPSDSGAPVYRLYNPNAGDHHYTMSVEERDTLVRLGWQYEGVAWNSADSSQLPLYRLYNPNALLAGAHHYTLSAEERDHLTSLGWRYEGIAWYGLTQ